MRYGYAIRELRQARGLGQRAVAEATGISENYVSMLEHDRRTPSVEMFQKLADLFKVPVFMIIFLASDEEDLAYANKTSVAAGRKFLEGIGINKLPVPDDEEP